MPIVVLGSDALLAALPATPVQLAHACLRAGFSNVIPASWGDELIAAGVLRRLPHFGAGPAIQCSCPIVAHRLLTVGGDLRPALIPLVPPPVAIARYVRTLSQPTRTRITYVGNCPGAVDDSIDIRMRPDALLSMLAERQILLDEQPRVFESIIPPDRRRFRSQPGGVPTAESLWTEFGSRTLVEIDGEDLVAELAQHLLSGKNILIDASARLGCACAGAGHGASVKDARASIIVLEPPRATTPVVEEQAPIELDLAVPAAPRTPIDVIAVPPNAAPAKPLLSPADGTMQLGHRVSPRSGLSAISEPRMVRATTTVNPRPVLGAAPVARDVEGKSLPRAYVARRRSPKGGVSTVAPLLDDSERHTAARAARSVPPRIAPVTPRPAHPPAAPREIPREGSLLPTTLTRRQLITMLAGALVVAGLMSTLVAVVVARSMRQPAAPAAAPVQP